MATKVSEALEVTKEKLEEFTERLLTTQEDEERQESCCSLFQLLIERDHEFQWDPVKREGDEHHNEYQSGIVGSPVIINLLKTLDNRYRFSVVKSGRIFSLVSIELLIESGHTMFIIHTFSEVWHKKEIGCHIKDLYEKVDNKRK